MFPIHIYIFRVFGLGKKSIIYRIFDFDKIRFKKKKRNESLSVNFIDLVVDVYASLTRKKMVLLPRELVSPPL